MIECEICKKDKRTSEGCNIEDIIIGDKIYERIKVGEKFDLYEGIQDEDFRCRDCGAKSGNYHHWECDAEKCPACHEQLIDCDCEEVYISEFESKEDSIKYNNNKKKIEILENAIKLLTQDKRIDRIFVKDSKRLIKYIDRKHQ